VHLRTKEEPSLETLWFKNKETMENVQNVKKSSKTAPLSKTFRDEPDVKLALSVCPVINVVSPFFIPTIAGAASVVIPVACLGSDEISQ
jgi:hypothetical protein